MIKCRLNSTVFYLPVIVAFVLLFFLVAECAASSNPASLLTNANACRNTLYKSSSRMNFRHNWENCIERYEKVYNSFPESDQAVLALFRAARMYVDLNRYSGREADLDKALELYNTITTRYADHRLADDAQFEKGQIYYLHKNNPTQAYIEYLKVDIQFPTGDMRPKAREMLDKLSSVLGRKQEQTQTQTQTSSKAEPRSTDRRTEVKNIRHWSTPTYTRVVIDLDQPVEYKTHLLREDPDLNMPRRLYIDLDNTYVGKDIEGIIPIKDGLLQRARAGQYDRNTVRVVLDIDNIQDYTAFGLHDPFRVVIDVRGEPIGAPKTKVALQPKETRTPRKGIMKPEKEDDTFTLARQLGLSVKRIVIDPGHGGRDPGTYFEGGIMEKDIILDIAKRLKTRIEKKLGYEVLLTRDSDVFVPLDERTAFANINKADLFISLHVNAHRQSTIFGVETYFLNMATDQRAIMVAARENATSEKNISDLQSILNDLMLNTKISESSRLAHQVQAGMINDISKNYTEYNNLGVKQAPFYVLIGAEMPAVLVEVGFITNPVERKRLLTDKYRDVIADGITNGIESYARSINQVSMGN